ncbi:hypothetical protein [Streptomyces sp. CA-179760]|uniref:hypothetical protein n=1 Tax=Streptomyces sp. CA-179760 TaxID=3240054 RepID=UPI003D8F871A
MPEELVESIKERVDARGVSGYVVAAAHQDAMGRLRELAERIEVEHGAVTDEEQQAALDRVAAIDGWHDEQRPHSDWAQVRHRRHPGSRGRAGSRAGAQATVFTSDTDDMNQLLAGHSVRVEKL